MKKLLIFSALLLIVLAGGWFAASRMRPAHPEERPYAVPALAKDYANDAYGFSLKMPEDFSASEIQSEDSGGETVILQDQAGNGIQIAISPFDEDTDGSYALTQERISQDVPDLKIYDAQVLEVGDHYKGLAFRSDNEAFGGASREVWFVFRHNLYQISTYERLDDLLKQIFETWQFR
jgi:hypothetical protein